MKLQTHVPLKRTDNPIAYSSKIFLVGSCFVKNIGGKLDYFKFQTLQNPFGILFHPLAVEKLIHRAVYSHNYQKSEVFERDGTWYCFDAHSDIRGQSEKQLLEKLDEGLRLTREWLQTATHIIITLGTAWVYEHSAGNSVVANCHKVPQKQFSKKLLSADGVQVSLENSIKNVEEINPHVQFIFTVSPVRHLKDGFAENQQSKAHLIAAIHSVLSSRVQSRNLLYFPAYEIMMDELRDYRFYEKDMVHPNGLAVDYIWEKFKSTWIDSEIYELMDEVDTIQKGLQHRPFNPESEQHQKFKEVLRTKIAYLQEKLPFVKF
ncbi:GSCFA domain-containing protein [Muricauda sp. JGD-17]|uniref:GSCFA domain-containing protein n=1 Tax=Flagellimonas ochracea TaxID=2696472 RepID=A0A964TC76_9FLAO|nr:GSCFA domain-containing protein [Allomuricauda ochracea]NAY92209.1 GSCFA domain-containing protein [Allomuricauda ochracea]